MSRLPVLLALIIVGGWGSLASATEATEKTSPHPTTLDDMPPLKLAVQGHLGISAEPVVFIAQTRIGESGTVYLCGLVSDGGNFSPSLLFFAEKRDSAITVTVIDQNPKTNGQAKHLCDTHGFRTPIPG